MLRRWHPAIIWAVFVLAAVVHAAPSMTWEHPLQAGVPLNESYNNYDVMCSNGVRCPTNYPICCGKRTVFCISGGAKCCESKYPPAASRGTRSCLQDETCCSGRDSMTCCKAGTVCSASDTATCAENTCSNHTSPLECVNHRGRRSPCGWCCATQACQELLYANSSCSSDLLTRETVPLQCKDHCMHAPTCRQCLQLRGSHNEPCHWCCQTQSCASSTRMGEVCDSFQVVESSDICQACGPDGHGIHLLTADPDSLTKAFVVTVGGVVFLGMALAAARVMARRNRAAQLALVLAHERQQHDQFPQYDTFLDSDSKVEQCAACSQDIAGGDNEQAARLIPCGHCLCPACTSASIAAPTEGRPALSLALDVCPLCSVSVAHVYIPSRAIR